MPCEDHVVGRADCPECVIIDTAERGPADTNVESATLVTDADLYIPRPDLGEHAHTFVAAGDEIPAHLAHLVSPTVETATVTTQARKPKQR